MIFIRVNLVFHEAEVHRMTDDVGISWRNSVIYRKGKKSLSILSVKIIIWIFQSYLWLIILKAESIVIDQQGFITTTCKCRASDILWKKNKISWDFQGQIPRNRPISGIFAGKKSKFVEKSADFAGFSRKNVKFRRIFRGKFLEKSADFTGNLGGKQKQKQPISLDFWWEISLKSINFASIWPALVNVFFNGDNHLLFQQQFAREMSEC